MTGEGGMQVLESRFQLNDQRVWFGKAKLLADRVVLKGLGYHRRIDLQDIVEVRWAADELVIVCSDGEEIDMTIRAAALWKYELQARCGLKDAGTGSSSAGALPPDPEPDGSSDSEPQRSPAPRPQRPSSPESQGSPDPETQSSGDGASDEFEEISSETSANGTKDTGEQTEMFLQRESSYRIRNGFAEDRPQQPKRLEDQRED